MNRFLKAQGFHHHQKVDYAVMSLEGNALIWWNALEDSGKAPTRWSKMKTALIAKFQTANEIQRAETNLYRLIQGKNTVQVYTAEFTKWSMQIPNLGEDEMYRCFYRGLSWKIQDEVDKRKHFIKNLTDLQTEASSIDDTLRKHTHPTV